MVNTRIVTVIVAVVMVAAATITPARSQSGLSDGLIACWNMDESSGPRADLINFHHLTDVNTVGYVAGKINSAAYVVAANTESLQRSITSDPAMAPSAFSVAMWVYPVSGNSNYLWSYYAGSLTVYGRYDDATDKFIFHISGATFGTTATYSPGQWYFVTWLYTPTGVGIRVDNTTEQWTYNTTIATRSGFWLGYSSTAYLDEVSLWDHYLTTGEVDDLYNAGSGVSCADITDDGGGTVVSGPLGYTYDVDLPSGETGVVEMYATAGDVMVFLAQVGMGATTLFYVVYRLAYATSRR